MWFARSQRDSGNCYFILILHCSRTKPDYTLKYKANVDMCTNNACWRYYRRDTRVRDAYLYHWQRSANNNLDSTLKISDDIRHDRRKKGPTETPSVIASNWLTDISKIKRTIAYASVNKYVRIYAGLFKNAQRAIAREDWKSRRWKARRYEIDAGDRNVWDTSRRRHRKGVHYAGCYSEIF